MVAAPDDFSIEFYIFLRKGTEEKEICFRADRKGYIRIDVSTERIYIQN
jgi:hypothetical protein